MLLLEDGLLLFLAAEIIRISDIYCVRGRLPNVDPMNYFIGSIFMTRRTNTASLKKEKDLKVESRQQKEDIFQLKSKRRDRSHHSL